MKPAHLARFQREVDMGQGRSGRAILRRYGRGGPEHLAKPAALGVLDEADGFHHPV